MVSKVNSVLWKYFNKDGESRMATCNYCNKTLSYKTTIANLKAHMKRAHCGVWKELCKELSIFKMKHAGGKRCKYRQINKYH